LIIKGDKGAADKPSLSYGLSATPAMNLTLKNILIYMAVIFLALIFFIFIFIASGPILFSPISTVPVIEGSSWEKKWGGIFEDESVSIDRDKNGNIYLAGSFVSFTDLNPGCGVNFNIDRFRFYISKFTSDGVYDWTKICDLNYTFDELANVILGGDSLVYIGNERSNIETYNLDGERIQDSPMNAIVGSPVDFDNDGNLYVTNDNLIKKFDEDGNQLWEYMHIIDYCISNVLYSGLRVKKNETTWEPRRIGVAQEKGSLFAL
jgi:hypothetical protein